MTSKLALTPLKSLVYSSHLIPTYQYIPNTSIQNKPLLIYRSAFTPSSAVNQDSIQSHISLVGVVDPQWVYTMYSTTHFHSTTHEVLCIASGSARCCFGGEDNPERVEQELNKGDVVIVPAGVGHRLMQEIKKPFEMVGSYPKGKVWDMCYGSEADREQNTKTIESLKWFDRDPIYGDQGPTLKF